MLQSIKRILEDTEQGPGRIIDLVIQILIFLSLVAVCLETVPELNVYEDLFYGFEVFTVTIFTIEYILRVATADKKLRFIFSFTGLVDFLAILPFYLTLTTVDLRFIRIFRLFRLVRILKLTKYTKAQERLVSVFREIKEELILFLLATVFILFVASAGIYFFEKDVQPKAFKSIFHSMWWAVATLTTVGYGDVYPKTIGGKIFTFVMLMVGLGVISVPSGLIASGLSNTKPPGDDKAEPDQEKTPETTIAKETLPVEREQVRPPPPEQKTKANKQSQPKKQRKYKRKRKRKKRR